MTLKEVQALSDEELRIKVAELAGWHSVGMRPYASTVHPLGVERGQTIWPHTLKPIPNYPQDLNATHKLLLALTQNQLMEVRFRLLDMLCPDNDGFEAILIATARQLCEVVVLTMEGI